MEIPLHQVRRILENVQVKLDAKMMGKEACVKKNLENKFKQLSMIEMFGKRQRLYAGVCGIHV